MAKHLKIHIKNTQIAELVKLGKLKPKLTKPAAEPEAPKAPVKAAPEELWNKEGLSKESPIKEVGKDVEEKEGEPQPLRTKARSHSAFVHEPPHETKVPEGEKPTESQEELVRATPETLFKQELSEPAKEEAVKEVLAPLKPPKSEPMISHGLLKRKEHAFLKNLPVREKFGPTGKHVKDLLPKAPPPKKVPEPKAPPPLAPKAKEAEEEQAPPPPSEEAKKGVKFKEFRDLKPAKRGGDVRTFDSRDSRGLRAGDEDARWRKRRQKQQVHSEEDTTVRPSTLKVRTPISIKDLAVEMKLKASQLVQKLFLQGVIVTLNDLLEDETTLQLLGHEFGCAITLDTSEAERIRITDKTISQEIAESASEALSKRPPVVAFMGHVDHGKTSLIDTIRKTNRVSGEAGAITQHIGAFMCRTDVGDIAILDTPGHEAFFAMRERGANVTDIIVLVVAGDEGIRQQTLEAIQHAKTGKVTIVVAINKSDKPGFNAENVWRQLSEQELLPEVWGGQTITVNCSAVTGAGVKELLEMLALQADVLELKADPKGRARGTVIESELHKGLGAKATVLVQNGTLKKGDALVFEQHWGRVKTMHDENGKELEVAGPSHPVEITGLSGLPEAGQEFIVVKSEKEAKEISEKRAEGLRQSALLIKKKFSMESMLETAQEQAKKVLNLVLRADVQGSLEALKSALEKIQSQKAELNIISTGVGEITESDVELAGASKALLLGFHTQIESHADTLVKELGLKAKLHDIIYHAVDDVKVEMTALLDKIPQETEKGKAFVKATFKSSQLGVIAGCQVTEGIINRNHLIRVIRNKEVIFKGSIASLKKVKEDVREVAKGVECGILIQGFHDTQENDIIEAYEITYLTQEL